MFLLLSIPAGVMIGLLLRGSSRKDEADFNFVAPWLPLVAIGIQLIIFTDLSPLAKQPDWVTGVAHMLSYLPLFAFLAVNSRITGIAIVALGIASNFTAIAANGGFMPASEWARKTAGFQSDAKKSNNSVFSNKPRLLILGDVLAIPKGYPLNNVFSFGDVLIFVGATAAIASSMRGVNQTLSRQPVACLMEGGLESKERLLRGR